MMSIKKTTAEIKCLIAPAEQRLIDCLQLWQAVKKAYFNPDGFRLALNNCIQALRSVTFVLQKHKSHFPHFDQWYSLWQRSMGEDAQMKWLVNARNVIVKEGDLETYSEVGAAVIESWYEPPVLVMKVPPFKRTEEIALILSEKLSSAASKELGILRLERRWVDSRLPHHELLEVLSHCFEVLTKLLLDAHGCIAGDSPAEECSWYRQQTTAASAVPPCMIRQESDRTIWLHLSTSRFLRPYQKPMKLTKEMESIARKRYKFVEAPKEDLEGAAGFETEAKTLFQFAKNVLSADGHHGPMAILGYPDGSRHHIPLEMEDRAAKHLIFRQLATYISKTGADSVILINEAWVGTPEDMARGLYPVDSPSRREALQLVAANNSGQLFQYTVLFHKDEKGEIVFGDEMVSEGEPNFLQPILSAWFGKKYRIPIFEKTKDTYRIEKTDLCPCKSGNRFENCCEAMMPTNAKKRPFELLLAQKYDEALIAYRAFLTQYIIWYNEHTVPLVKNEPLEADDLLRIDIDAVIGTVSGIADCLDALGRADEIDEFLSRAVDIIHDDRYALCVRGERALRLLIKGDDKKANKLLKSLQLSDTSGMMTIDAGRRYLALLSDWVKSGENESRGNDR